MNQVHSCLSNLLLISQSGISLNAGITRLFNGAEWPRGPDARLKSLKFIFISIQLDYLTFIFDDTILKVIETKTRNIFFCVKENNEAIQDNL